MPESDHYDEMLQPKLARLLLLNPGDFSKVSPSFIGVGGLPPLSDFMKRDINFAGDCGASGGASCAGSLSPLLVFRNN